MSTLEEVLERVASTAPARVVFLTGAGVSAESGVPTFRGPQGLWNDYRPEDLATPQAFRRDPRLVWEWYEWRRDLVRKASPNDAHFAMAELERHASISSVIVTQNVDGLHRRGGARNVVELHGNLFRTRCTAERTVREAEARFDEIPPRCECGAMLRPDVVWFGEVLPEDSLRRASAAVAASDLFMVVGTSGVVFPAAGLISLARGLIIEINPELTPLSGSCDFSLQLPAARAVPAIADVILAGIR